MVSLATGDAVLLTFYCIHVVQLSLVFRRGFSYISTKYVSVIWFNGAAEKLDWAEKKISSKIEPKVQRS